MPVEIRKLVIKGIVQEKIPTQNNRSLINHRSGKRELEREQANFRKLKKEILNECRELVEIILERKTNRY